MFLCLLAFFCVHVFLLQSFSVCVCLLVHVIAGIKRYDIKGSTRNRISDPEDHVGKDVNFDEDPARHCPSNAMPCMAFRQPKSWGSTLP